MKKFLTFIIANILFLSSLMQYAFATNLVVDTNSTQSKIIDSTGMNLVEILPEVDETAIPIPTDTDNKNWALQNSLGIYYEDGVAYKKGELKGEFSLTGYCTCTKCTKGAGITYTGTIPRHGHTVAADKTVLPMGTMIILEGTTAQRDIADTYNGVYRVEDIGGAVKGNMIDIYQSPHEAAVAVTVHGRRYANVYLAIPIQ